MGHVFVYILVAICGVTAQETTIDAYTTTEPTEFQNPTTSIVTPTYVLVPEEPTNLTVVDFTSTSIYLQWHNPVRRNGVIEGYRVYFTKKNMTDVVPESVPFAEPVVKYNLTKLEPMTEYKIAVKAFTHRHEGPLSQPITAYTDNPGPSAPKIIALECQINDSMVIRWQRPEVYVFNIDYYYLFVILGNKLYDNITISTSREHIQLTYKLKDLKVNTVYKIQVQAASRSNRTGRIIGGAVSTPMEIILRKDCEEPMDYFTRATSELGVGILAGMLCASVGLFLTGLGYLIYKRCFRAPYYYLDSPQCTPAPLDWNEPPTDPEAEAEYTGPIAVKDFPQHVQRLHSDGDIGFSKQYEAIQNDAVNDANSSEHSQHPDNKPKNRYLNIIAYDHSRVRLLTLPEQKVSTYINANYIDGFQVTRAYIGTQGPLPSTFDCFWRMIWEQRVTIIVMITNLVERGRRKCDMYWPKEGTETYGLIEVRISKEEVTATYTVRTLVLTHLRVRLKGNHAEKTVYQYHYTNWPDHGTPDHPLPVIHFIKKSSAANPPNGGPIVVHCSAGVGRTGTYIVLDAMLKQIRARGEVNIFGFLKHIRAQRNFLVQTEEQYIFIHDALVEAIECGETNILREEFPRYVSQLQNLNQEDKNESWKPLDVQYALVTRFVPRDYNLVSANKIVNKPKNRSTQLLPVESARVHLTPKPGEEGSDYINATWLQGFHSQREFIITQHPFKTTREDFWQMVWDHSAQLIVMMSQMDDEEFGVFWPVGSEIIETDTYTCKQTHENPNAVYHMREFLLRSVQDDYEFPVKMLHCHNWPHCLKGGLYEMYHLPNFVLDLQKFQNGPIVVVDKIGGTEAATFCALTTLKKHLLHDNKVDVYMYSKLYHNRRPGIWRVVNDYLNLHLCVQTLCLPPEPKLEVVVTPREMYAINNGGMSTDSVRVPPEERPLMGQF
ncbi:unnamed protein product [Acanthoscelides obtectus]|uniref:Protein-tyrosine-phosphatase n=1 Tax=Acanthoscelides obtectus TaxID=200917 RepID=A0A9P0LUP5_ACAOB|nr:unnamed protein product [Acanthoscelides obtectus]CAK1628409.1 Tyrosine-protein phosphatase 99A [Acanthoscelides obtectus]